MNARQISKNIEIVDRALIPHEGEIDPKNPPEPQYREISRRVFVIYKYSAFDGLKVGKLLLAKALPVFDTFIPLLTAGAKGNAAHVLENLGQYIQMDAIAATLDKVLPEDLDFIMRTSLMNVYEKLPAGEAQVLNSDGTYGVNDIEFDPLIVLRLTCEAVMWGVGDFFDGNRLGSIMSPLISTSR